MKNLFLVWTLVLLNSMVLSAQTKTDKSFCHTEPSAIKAIPSNMQTMNSMSSANCPKYVVRVYFHFVKMDGNPGYSSSNISTLMNELNTAFYGTGISLNCIGDRNWYSPTWANPSTPSLQFYNGVFDDPASVPKPNAINLYILPDNVQPAAGRAIIGGNKLWLAGKRAVVFNCTSTDYIIPISRVVAHEMGHCLGLNHTNRIGDGDGDGLSDTPRDYSDKDGCVNPSTCQFAGIQPPNQPGGPPCNDCDTNANPEIVADGGYKNVMGGSTLPWFNPL